MDALWRMAAGVWTALVAMIVSRAALAIAHLYDWYPEKILAAWVVAINRRFGDLIGRFFVRFGKPPIIPDAPGLVWKRRKDGWQAIWKPRSDIFERGYPIKQIRLALEEKFSPVQKRYISEQCVHLQHDMLKFDGSAPPAPVKRKKQRKEPSMEEILRSIREIIAADDIAAGRGRSRLPLA
jgi:hypothetical protein